MKVAPQYMDEIPCYAPELAIENDGYPDVSYGDYFKLEDGSFWFRSRNRIIKYLIEKFMNTNQPFNFIEIGCGTGYVLKGLEAFTNAKLSGAEIYLGGLKFAKKRLPNIQFVQLDARYMPFENELDSVGAFDVLEHIVEDETVMQSVFQSLKSGGKFFISVPQHQSLYCDIDAYLQHKRRYSRSEMLTKLKNAGFEIEFVSSFVFCLFPMMAISRWMKKIKPSKLNYQNTVQTEMVLPPALDKIMDVFMDLDQWLIKIGLSLPVGGSLFVVAKKK